VLTPSPIGEDLTDFFCAGQISTALKDAVAVDLTEAPSLAEQHLRQARFDQAPVMHGGRPVGWVSTETLARGRNVKSVMTPFEDCRLVSAQASIAAILKLLPDDKFIFTVSEEGVRSDIDRHAVRSYLYLLVSRIEMLLGEIVESKIDEDRVAAKIRKEMLRAYKQARAENQENQRCRVPIYRRTCKTLQSDTLRLRP
jgi:hypothetical protein